LLDKIVCKAIDYIFLFQDDKVVIFNIPPTRKALPESLHVRTRNKKMVQGLFLITEMTFIWKCNFISADRVALVGRMWCTILNWKMATLISFVTSKGIL